MHTIRYIRYSLLCCIYLFASLTLSSAQETKPDKPSKIKVKNSDNFIHEQLEGVDYQYFRGNVKIFHDSIYMFSDSATVISNNMTAVGNVIIIQEDSINVFADSLIYNAELKRAQLYDDVVLETSDKKLFTNALTYNLETKLATFRDTAILEKGTMTLSSLSGQYNVKEKRAYFFDEVVIIDEDFKLTSDSLNYDTDTDRAYFIGPTYIRQDDKKIFCQSGYYDLEDGRAFFSDNARIIEDGQIAQADDILFSDIDSSLILTGNAIIEDSTSIAKGKEISINNSTDEIRLFGNAYYKNEDQEVTGPEIIYNKNTKDLKLLGRSTISGSNTILVADTVDYVKAIDRGIAKGNVTWQDTVNNRQMLADKVFYSDSIAYYKAITIHQKPLFIDATDGDSLFLCADTLINAEPTDTTGYIQAISNVKIYKTDLQGKCDSLHYSQRDSTFYLYGNPIVWADTTQFSGDSIFIVMKNDAVSEIIADGNGFIISQENVKYYNQIKSKHIKSFLADNELHRMEVTGNSESIYLIKDESDAYMGINKTLCDRMTFFFENKELDEIKFYTQPSSTMTPIQKAAEKDFKLEGFFWNTEDRPIGSIGLRTITKRSAQANKSDKGDEDLFASMVDSVMENDTIQEDSKPDESIIKTNNLIEKSINIDPSFTIIENNKLKHWIYDSTCVNIKIDSISNHLVIDKDSSFLECIVSTTALESTAITAQESLVLVSAEHLSGSISIFITYITDSGSYTTESYILIEGDNEIPLEEKGQYSKVAFHFKGEGTIEIVSLMVLDK